MRVTYWRPLFLFRRGELARYDGKEYRVHRVIGDYIELLGPEINDTPTIRCDSYSYARIRPVDPERLADWLLAQWVEEPIF